MDDECSWVLALMLIGGRCVDSERSHLIYFGHCESDVNKMRGRRRPLVELVK